MKAGAARQGGFLLAAWLLSASPALAGIAEREPPAVVLWLTLATVVGLCVVMVNRRWWLPLMLWLPVAFAASCLIADLGDPVIGPEVMAERGMTYVLQADLWAALVVALPLAFANLRFGRNDGKRR